MTARRHCEIKLYKGREVLKRLLTDVHECSHMQPSEARGKEKGNNQIGLYKFAAE